MDLNKPNFKCKMDKIGIIKEQWTPCAMNDEEGYMAYCEGIKDVIVFVQPNRNVRLIAASKNVKEKHIRKAIKFLIEEGYADLELDTPFSEFENDFVPEKNAEDIIILD